jgi:hypothetical protein
MNRCAACHQPLAWQDNAPALWDGPFLFLFCSAPCRDRFRRRAQRPLQAA